jgi:hypothetical protein
MSLAVKFRSGASVLTAATVCKLLLGCHREEQLTEINQGKIADNDVYLRLRGDVGHWG